MDSKKYILVISPWFPCPSQPYRGIFIEDWVKAMGCYFNLEVEVIHICPIFEPRSGFFLRSVIEEDKTYRVHHLYVESKYPKIIKNWPNLIPKMIRPYIESQIIRKKPDMIHQHSLFLSGDLIFLLHKKYSIPYVITEHWSHIHSHLTYNPRRFSLLRALRNSQHLMAVSSSLSNILQRHLRGKEILVTPNFVSNDFYYKKGDQTTTENPIKLLWVGDLKHRGKKISLLLGALNRLSFRQKKSFHLYLIDRSHFLDGYELLIKKMPFLRKNTTYIGAISRFEIADYMRSADILVHPTGGETFGLVVAEALCCGLPCWVSDKPHINTWIMPKSGRLISNNIKSWHQALIELLNPSRQELFRAEISRIYRPQFDVDHWRHAIAPILLWTEIDIRKKMLPKIKAQKLHHYRL